MNKVESILQIVFLTVMLSGVLLAFLRSLLEKLRPSRKRDALLFVVGLFQQAQLAAEDEVRKLKEQGRWDASLAATYRTRVLNFAKTFGAAELKMLHDAAKGTGTGVSYDVFVQRLFDAQMEDIRRRRAAPPTGVVPGPAEGDGGTPGE